MFLSQTIGDAINNVVEKFGNWLGGLWDDWTGKSAVDIQNQGNLDMAKYQQQVEEELYNKYRSPQAIMKQYAAAGLNPNLIYGSASAGIGSSPHFNAPHVERNLSGSEKINTALSAISSVLGLKQALYQTDAAREAAEQSAVKTLSDRVNLLEKQGNLRLKNSLFGFPIYYDEFARKHKDKRDNEFFVSPGTAYPFGDSYMAHYIKAYRSNELNSLYRSQFGNVADYGISATADGLKIDNYFGTPSIRTRNAMNSLKYRLTQDIGNMDKYGKLILGLFDLLK